MACWNPESECADLFSAGQFGEGEDDVSQTGEGFVDGCSLLQSVSGGAGALRSLADDVRGMTSNGWRQRMTSEGWRHGDDVRSGSGGAWKGDCFGNARCPLLTLLQVFNVHVGSLVHILLKGFNFKAVGCEARAGVGVGKSRQMWRSS